MELPRALAFAGRRRNGVLVTQKRDGRPQLSNVVYAVTAGVVRISTTADRAKYANLRRDPRASLYVGGEDFGAYLVIEGDASLTVPAADPGDPTVAELVELYRSIAGEHPDWDDYRRAMVAERRVVVRLQPAGAYGMTPP